MRHHNLLLDGLLVLVLTAFVKAELKIGTLKSPNCFAPVAKFAYATTPGDTDDGRFHARVQFRSKNYKHLYLVTYTQEEWRQVYRSNLTCAARVDAARGLLGRFYDLHKRRSSDHLVVNVHDAYFRKLKDKEDKTGEPLVSCSDGTVRYDTKFKIRDADTDWFYVALINADSTTCNATGGVRCQGPLMNISYRFNFRNLNYVGYLDALPANKIGLVHVTSVNLVCSIALVIIALIVSVKLKSVNEYHYIVEAPNIKRQMVISKKILQSNEVIERFELPPETLVSKGKHVKNKCHITIMGLVAAIFFYFLANVFWFSHYMVFIANEGLELVIDNFFYGNKVRILYLLGEICWVISDAFMAVIGIVLAKGWTLLRRKLSARSRAVYGLLLSFYFFVGWWAIFWNVTFYTEFDAVDFYDSLPTALFLGCRLLLCIGFLWAIFTTLRSFKVKRKFFIKFAILYGLWFCAIAIFGGILNAVDRTYVYREALLHVVMSFCTLLAQFLLIFMYWPKLKCCLAKRFPFHADVADMLNPGFHQAMDIIKENHELSAKDIMQKIRENDVDPLSKLLAIMKEIDSRLETLEDNEVDLRCAFEELENEDERMDDMGQDLDAERRAPKLHAFGNEDFAQMEAEHNRLNADRPH